MNKLLVIVDMQNDFVTGSLANPEAEKIVPGIVDLINKWDDEIVTTKDTHEDNYLDTQEGRRLPIRHCILGESGQKIVKDISDALQNNSQKYLSSFSYTKDTFGSIFLGRFVKAYIYDEIYLCGTCTDICVISNAIMCKSFSPESRIVVLKDLCAGTTKENHENALKAMAQCQIDIE